jgi:ankyrin repeat protein
MEGNKTLLHLAVEINQISVARALLEASPQLSEVQHRKQSTPLHLAAREGQREMVALLLKFNPQLANITDVGYRTADWLAINSGFHDLGEAIRAVARSNRKKAVRTQRHI